MPHFDLQNASGFIIYRTAIRLKNELNRLFAEKKIDVTTDQWRVMITLWQNEGLTQTQISGRLVKDKTSLTAILDRMEKKELIVRAPDTHDRRSYNIFLTNKSKTLIPTLITIAEGLTTQIMEGINEKEIQIMKKALNKIYYNLGK